MRYTELREKEVVSVCDGRFLGYISDLEIEECDLKITVLFVRQPPKGIHKYFPWLFQEPEFAIAVKRIEQIGKDVILVVEANS